MEKILKYIEDPDFVKWVKHPDKDLDDYWNNYISVNESEKENIRKARLIIAHLQAKSETTAISSISAEIYTSVLQQIELKRKRPKTTFRLNTFLKYAAIGIVFFALGIAVTQYIKPDTSNGLFDERQIQNSSQYSTLILSDGSNVKIPDKTTEIVYKSNGQIVINNRDTVQAIERLSVQDQNVLFVPYGKNASLVLPDGTKAHINAGSRLVYPSKFEGSERIVSLIGEGFFEVAHNAEKPFIVKSQELSIEVLGTKFDFSAYPGEKIIETVLVEGKVKIIHEGALFGNKEYILEPNQRAAYNVDTKTTNIAEVDVENYVAWHKGYLIFETQDLNRVIKKLERYYNLKIKLTDPTLGLLRISGKLELKEDKDIVLNVLAKTASLDLIQTNDSEYILK